MRGLVGDFEDVFLAHVILAHLPPHCGAEAVFEVEWDPLEVLAKAALPRLLVLMILEPRAPAYVRPTPHGGVKPHSRRRTPGEAEDAIARPAHLRDLLVKNEKNHRLISSAISSADLIG